MACDIQGILQGSSALQAELANYSEQEVLAAIYILTCKAGQQINSGLTCSPSAVLSSGDPCVFCASPQELLAAIAMMACEYAVPLISSAQLQNGIVGQPYSTKLFLYRGSASNWAITSGALPAGLTLNAATGVISGTPSATNTGVPFTVRAKNSIGADFEILSIAVDSACTFPSVTQNETVYGALKSKFVHQVGGTGSAPFTWDVVGTPLPPGLTGDPYLGVISGVPTASGTFVVPYRAINACGNSTDTITFVITP